LSPKQVTKAIIRTSRASQFRTNRRPSLRQFNLQIPRKKKKKNLNIPDTDKLLTHEYQQLLNQTKEYNTRKWKPMTILRFTDRSPRVERDLRPSCNFNSNNSSQLQQVHVSKSINNFKFKRKEQETRKFDFMVNI
jgi:hypothetical protein